MACEPRLFPVDVDIALMTFTRQPGGWSLVVRSGPSGSRLLERPVEQYELLTADELVDVVIATMDGWRPGTPPAVSAGDGGAASPPSPGR